MANPIKVIKGVSKAIGKATAKKKELPVLQQPTKMQAKKQAVAARKAAGVKVIKGGSKPLSPTNKMRDSRGIEIPKPKAKPTGVNSYTNKGLTSNNKGKVDFGTNKTSKAKIKRGQ
jgi:hypothetical protein